MGAGDRMGEAAEIHCVDGWRRGTRAAEPGRESAPVGCGVVFPGRWGMYLGPDLLAPAGCASDGLVCGEETARDCEMFGWGRIAGPGVPDETN